jgi:predicted nucleotidyltransferase
MRDVADRVITPFLTQVDAALDGGYSAILYGSAARGDFVPGRSDLNLMLIVDDLSPRALAALSAPFAAWAKSGYEPPLVIGRPEWQRASDVFPIEITDMRAGYEVLRGTDPLAGLEVVPADLRHALERELRGKLLRLRQGYVAAAGEAEKLGSLAGRSAGTVMVLLRALLALLGRAVPREPVELAAAAAAAMGIEGEPLLNVIRHRAEPGWRCSPVEFAGYMETVARAAAFLDQLQLGDQR